MAHNLTPVDAFTLPISVPDGIDTHNTAANVVAAIAQALANHTAYLKARYDTNTGKLDSVNTWVHKQFIDTVDNEEPMISSQLTSIVSGFPDSAWRLFCEFFVYGTVKVRMYWGQNDSDSAGAFCITLNALYSTDTSDPWYADEASQPSFALFMHQTRLRTAVKTNGDLHWDWVFKGAIDVGHIDATSVVSTGDVTAGDDVIAGDDVTAGGEFLYTGTHARTGGLTLADVYGAYKRLTSGGIAIDTTVPDPLQLAAWPIRLPVGSVLGDVELIVFQSSVDQILISLQIREIDFSTPGATSVTTPASVLASTSLGYKKLTLVIGGTTVDANKEYQVIFQTNSGLSPGVANDYVSGIRMLDWEDPGPTNHM